MPFLIVQVTEGKLGTIWQRSTLDAAIDFATKLAMEQCDTSEEEISGQLTNDLSFTGGGFTIYITQAEED